jgi:quercetin dioxygenase-like cupin family protein
VTPSGLILALALMATAGAAMAQTAAPPVVARTPILGVDLTVPATVQQVRGMRIDFAAGQKPGRHQHPIPVVGYLVSGEITFQVAGGAVQTLKPGDAFYLMGPGETQFVKPAP